MRDEAPITGYECPIINKEYPMSKSRLGARFYKNEWFFPSSLDIPCWILDIRQSTVGFGFGEPPGLGRTNPSSSETREE
jgi:hypothetical protein